MLVLLYGYNKVSWSTVGVAVVDERRNDSLIFIIFRLRHLGLDESKETAADNFGIAVSHGSKSVCRSFQSPVKAISCADVLFANEAPTLFRDVDLAEFKESAGSEICAGQISIGKVFLR